MVVLLRPEFRRRLLGPLPSADSGPPTCPTRPVAPQGNRTMAACLSELRKHRVGATVPLPAQEACTLAWHGARRSPPNGDMAPDGHECGSEATSARPPARRVAPCIQHGTCGTRGCSCSTLRAGGVPCSEAGRLTPLCGGPSCS